MSPRRPTALLLSPLPAAVAPSVLRLGLLQPPTRSSPLRGSCGRDGGSEYGSERVFRMPASPIHGLADPLQANVTR
jgi:hypothetical protein